MDQGTRMPFSLKSTGNVTFWTDSLENNLQSVVDLHYEPLDHLRLALDS